MSKRLLVATVVAALAGAAHAQFQKPEDAVKYRQGAFTVMGNHFSRIGAMVQGRVPFDAKVAQENAALVVTLSKLPWAGFTPESEKIKSRTKPEAWREMDKVRAGADKMMKAVADLEAATRTGNLDAVKKTFGDAAATCKACHDAYRE
ncbi:cytochrome c [Tepidimonas taiwanensis]|uniref:Cytochrome c n=1 Tax=Tepidimonas taiwanensis TaxID=307486 RepID=A0A554X2V5_9BURK|nr:cytochrome c [Tepidimonas taiwanensis]TSE30158.1 Cytochrome c' [Tepidimonas taiwanensis]UBQ05524.1 cytochrome c [Tepidimonas taiwanensis]